MLIEKVYGPIYSHCRIPGIVMTEKGTLLAYYECRRTRSDWADIDIKIIRSTDGGDSWDTVTVINSRGNTLNNPVMFVKGAEIHFLFLENYKLLFHSVSTDDGLTFSQPEQKTFDCDFFYNVVAVGPGHGIVHNRKMIVPAWFAQNPEAPLAHRPSIISTLWSEDGNTWHLGEVLGADVLVNPSECALAVMEDNRILISIRNENGTYERAFAVSEDGISNWQDLHFDSRMNDPICMGSMAYENGTLYHINCDSKTARENLTVKKSTDGFETYESIFVDTPAGYADLAVKNGTGYIFYERDCDNGGLYFQKIEL